ncbi:MAG: hypothetical protein NTV09_10675 [Bacteroidetes bacterium]|nr:hypothetical protein [Bacteroidota bacterium]
MNEPSVMQPSGPTAPEVIFLLLTFFLLGATVLAVGKVSGNRKITLRIFLAIFLWLSLLKIISGMNFFHNYSTMPPWLMIGPLGCLLAIVFLATSKSFSGFLQKVPLHWLIYIQGFRVVMELVLYHLAESGVIHQRMTFAGSNFDILAGITAFIVGWMVQKNKISKAGLITWNIICAGLLVNIIVIAALSTPYPFSIFKDEPVNTVIFYFPFVWLPGFVAPYALAMHVFAMKKVIGRTKPV